MTNFEELQKRGLIKDVAGEGIEELINKGGVTFYWGTDPTADSLHLGHYSSLVTAKRLMKMGHNPILLCGGATGRIGDPRPTSEREIIDIDVLNHNIECIRKQIDDIFEGKARLVNNYEWFKDYNYLDFLRDIGKYINVNYMLSKDIINRRLETGITYAEFSYMLIQGYDFLHMYQDLGCTMQVEGSDQWGNITTGIELIRKILGREAYGFTMPLILDSNGKKFGKSEGNAVWLDKNKTSSYELYQYLINTDDSKVEEYLKVFTFLSLDEIDAIMACHKKAPEQRGAQKELAKQIITDLRGEDEFLHAKEVSEALFTGNIKNLTDDEIKEVFKGVPTITYEDKDLIDILVSGGITSSKREAREFLASGAILVNGLVVHEENYHLENKTYNIIRRGKKKYYLVVKEG